MTDTGPPRIGPSFEVKPHAYDPRLNPELFEGVMARRVVAFFIDLVVIMLPVVLVMLFMVAATIATVGVAGFLFVLMSPLYWPMIVVWTICYYGLTLGGPRSATIGMRMMDLEMRTWYGAPVYFLLGAVHATLFWVTIWAPIVLIVPLFNERRRLLHDILIGTIVINNPERAQLLREGRYA